MKKVSLLGLALVCIFLQGCDEATDGKKLLSDLSFQVGVTHVSGDYRFTDQNFLEEGFQKVRAFGAPSIFVYLTPDYQNVYPGNSGNQWPHGIHSLKELAQTTPYKNLFESPFKVFVLTIYTFSVDGRIWIDSRDEDYAAKEESEVYELAKYLYETYKGTGKIFVFKHWEGDWFGLRSTAHPELDITAQNAQDMVDWLNARQRGLNRAREEFAGGDKVGIFNAVEVNRVLDHSRLGLKRVVDQVVPRVNSDMVAYSAYDSMSGNLSTEIANFNESLGVIRSFHQDTLGLGNKRVFISEYGTPENEFSQQQITNRARGVIQVAQDQGLWGAFAWQLFDNECQSPTGANLPHTAYGINDPMRPNNGSCRGFWLTKPDGTTSVLYNFLRTFWQ